MLQFDDCPNKQLSFCHFDQNLMVEYTKGRSDARSWVHYHDNYEIYYLLSGKRQYFINDKIYRIEKGDVIIIKPYEIHRTTLFIHLLLHMKE